MPVSNYGISPDARRSGIATRSKRPFHARQFLPRVSRKIVLTAISYRFFDTSDCMVECGIFSRRIERKLLSYTRLLYSITYGVSVFTIFEVAAMYIYIPSLLENPERNDVRPYSLRRSYMCIDLDADAVGVRDADDGKRYRNHPAVVDLCWLSKLAPPLGHFEIFYQLVCDSS